MSLLSQYLFGCCNYYDIASLFTIIRDVAEELVCTAAVFISFVVPPVALALRESIDDYGEHIVLLSLIELLVWQYLCGLFQKYYLE